MTDATGKELTAAEMHAVFHREYVAPTRRSRSSITRSGQRRRGHPRTADRALSVDGVETLLGAPATAGRRIRRGLRSGSA